VKLYDLIYHTSVADTSDPHLRTVVARSASLALAAAFSRVSTTQVFSFSSSLVSSFI
jgi:hypothetical protein